MIDVYLAGVALVAGVALLFLVIACAAHLEFKDAESAENVRMVSYFMLSSLVWPLLLVGLVGFVLYALTKGLWTAFKRN